MYTIGENSSSLNIFCCLAIKSSTVRRKSSLLNSSFEHRLSTAAAAASVSPEPSPKLFDLLISVTDRLNSRVEEVSKFLIRRTTFVPSPTNLESYNPPLGSLHHR